MLLNHKSITNQINMYFIIFITYIFIYIVYFFNYFYRGTLYYKHYIAKLNNLVMSYFFLIN